MDPHECLPHDALFVRSVPFANLVVTPVGSRCRAECGEDVPKSCARLHGCVACSLNFLGVYAGWLDARRAPCFDPQRRGACAKVTGNGCRTPAAETRHLSPAGPPPLWIIHTKGSFLMNSAPQVETVEISDAELDNVSGGLSPHASVVAGPTAVSDSSVLAQVDAVKNEVLGTVGQYHHVSASVSV
jgi:hypothetical protein